jgi:hypothetical protein
MIKNTSQQQQNNDDDDTNTSPFCCKKRRLTETGRIANVVRQDEKKF